MAWTKVKTTVVAGVIVLLAAGTTTVAVKEVKIHYLHNDNWRRQSNFDSRVLDSAGPIVSLVFFIVIAFSGLYYPIKSGSALSTVVGIFPIRHLIVALVKDDTLLGALFALL